MCSYPELLLSTGLPLRQCQLPASWHWDMMSFSSKSSWLCIPVLPVHTLAAKTIPGRHTVAISSLGDPEGEMTTCSPVLEVEGGGRRRNWQSSHLPQLPLAGLTSAPRSAPTVMPHCWQCDSFFAELSRYLS